MAPARTPDSIRRLRENIKETFTVTQQWLANVESVKTVRELRRRILTLEQRHEEARRLNDELILEDPDETGEVAIELENLFISTIANAETILDQLESRESSHTHTTSSMHTCSQQYQLNVRLPKLSLPEFRGLPTDNWISFFQRFSAALKDPAIPDVHRQEYLYSCLKGDAASRVEGIDILEGNYDVAVEVLRQRYENRRLNLRRYLSHLFNLKSVKENDADSMRHLVDTATVNIRAVENIGFHRDQLSNELIAQLVVSKLDSRSRELWETLISEKTPLLKRDEEEDDTKDSFKDLMTFLEKRIQVLASVFINSSPTAAVSKPKPPPHRIRSAATLVTQPVPAPQSPSKPVYSSSVSSPVTEVQPCPCCQQLHQLYQCDTFKRLSAPERYNIVRQSRVCINCLKPGHWSLTCKSSKCRQCAKPHHTMLHNPKPSSAPPTSQASAAATPPSVQSTTSQASPSSTTTSSKATVFSGVAQQRLQDVLLSTASVQLASSTHQINATALLDGGSHVTLLTKAIAQQLNLKLVRSSVIISGLGGGRSSASATTTLHLTSCNGQYSTKLHAVVVDAITDPLPPVSFIPPDDWDYAQHYDLADPQYFKSKVIDILIGVDHLYSILQPTMITQPNRPTLISSQLGWLLAGPYSTSSMETSVRCLHSTLSQPEIESISEFLGVNEAPRSKDSRSVDEIECERIFAETHKRDPISGRFIVSLPKRSGCVLGESRQLAISRLKRARVSEEYREFLREYESLGHMTRCAPPIPGQVTYYIPHHSVHHNGKIRVVFDASMKSSNGVSLNGILLVGPTLQAPLFIIFLRFRTFLYAFTADIIKMYRQMWVPDEDRDLQRIVIYENGEIVDCRLNTITYGTSSAPHSAVRSLFQLAEDGKKQFPAAAAVILKNTYIDDTLGGADSLEAVKQLIDELVALLRTACMELSKWRFSGELAAQTPLCSSSVGRTLGVEWNSAGDFFCFSSLVNFASSDKVLTKRSALSKVSSIFDPLGFLAPVTITGKLLIQELWTDNLDWDETVSTDFLGRFNRFLSDVAASANLEFPRFIGSSKFSLELHGFADASKEAYAACIYARIVSGTNPPIVRFVASKTRVTPQKQPRTIPELELCAAALLVELFDPVAATLGCSPEHCFAYTDSTIVLAYLAKEPGNWTTFVANRVEKIITKFQSDKWRHVPGEINPADMATRRKSFVEFESRASLWISGPKFLSDPVIMFPVPVTASISLVSLSASIRHQSPEAQIASFNYVFAPVSRYDRLQRAAAHVFRYVSVLTSRVRKQSIPKGPLTIEEMVKAETWLIRVAQAHCFQEEVTQLRLQRSVGSKSQLRALDPRLYNGVLRVGGRLENSALPFHQKHPIILQSTHRLSILLVRHVHFKYFHSGNRFTANILRSKYWFIGDVTAKVRQCISTCARCIRFSGRPPSVPLMGDLPASRVQSSLPFTHVGVDYAGPFQIRERLRSARGPARTHKAYWCLFVCMSTKAAHLEVVSELSTAAFLAALQRFVGRRGLPNSITSDNGTNFVGADAELRRHVAALEKDDAVQNHCVSQGITWKFNPPAAPHMGGIFEALVKSTKYHFKRVVGSQILTFEEMATILVQIEAILNSRPLIPLSSPDQTHFEVLTPSHLLIGRPINAVPSDYKDIHGLSYSQRWRLINQLRNSFWRQWAEEYLRTLQKRTKWRSPVSHPVQIDDIVLISDEQSPPLVWPLGRITKLHPGKDGQIRVVDLVTRNGACLQRPVSKLIPLVNAVDD